MNSRSNLLLLQLKWHLTQNIPLKSAGYTGLFQNLPCSSLSIRPRFPVWDLHSTPSLVIYKQLFPPNPAHLQTLGQSCPDPKGADLLWSVAAFPGWDLESHIPCQLLPSGRWRSLDLRDSLESRASLSPSTPWSLSLSLSLSLPPLFSSVFRHSAPEPPKRDGFQPTIQAGFSTFRCWLGRCINTVLLQYLRRASLTALVSCCVLIQSLLIHISPSKDSNIIWMELRDGFPILLYSMAIKGISSQQSNPDQVSVDTS